MNKLKQFLRKELKDLGDSVRFEGLEPVPGDNRQKLIATIKRSTGDKVRVYWYLEKNLDGNYELSSSWYYPLT